jgi:mannose-1-phosphate guanylyltransferase
VYTDSGLVAVVGLDEVVVVKDGDTILVCRRDKTEDIKKIVEQLKAEKKDQYL